MARTDQLSSFAPQFSHSPLRISGLVLTWPWSLNGLNTREQTQPHKCFSSLSFLIFVTTHCPKQATGPNLTLRRGSCLGRGGHHGLKVPQMATKAHLLIYSPFHIQLVDDQLLFTKVHKVPFSTSSGSQGDFHVFSGYSRVPFDPETNELKTSIFCPT